MRSLAVVVFCATAYAAPSDEDSLQLLDVAAQFNPERGSQVGLEKWDEKAVDLGPNYAERERAQLAAMLPKLEKHRATDPIDIEILVKWTKRRIRGSELEEKYLVPYFPIERMIFGGVRPALEDQIPAERRQKMVTRLRAYAGLIPGTTPLAKQAEARMRERLKVPGLLMPVKAQLEKNLSTGPAMMKGVEGLCKKYSLACDEALAALKTQVTAYDEFLKTEILPKAREDFRLPPELYAQHLDEVGIDIAPAELAKEGHAAFLELQKEMQALAPKVAAQHHLNVTDYRQVIAALKKDQLVGDAILPHYQARLADLEKIIRDHKLVTLPARPAIIHLASEAESAAIPAPHMTNPPFIHNTGERGTFVLPLSLPAPPGSPKGATQKLDDFSFTAASWTLTAHEARPGHELQFDQMVERHVSLAREIFAWNSVNSEGWGLYSEYISFPYMPPDGQLISLQHRLMRAARAFLDPEMQSGKLDRAAAKKILMEDVGLSDPMSTSEVERYMFWFPGQAGSYFYGYTRLLALRQEIEKREGAKFDAQKLHDFILAQGLLPIGALREVVAKHFQ